MNLTFDRNKNKFIATFPYNPQWIAQLRSIPGSRFSLVNRQWTLPVDLPVFEKFKEIFPFAKMDDAAAQWYADLSQQMQLNEEQKKHGPYVDTDFSKFTFKTKPYEHQLKALDLVINNPSFALLMEMRTGKTWVIVNLLSHLKREGKLNGPALVVCPLSVCSVWESEIRKHADNLTCQILTGDKHDRRDKLGQAADVYVINYEGLRIMESDLSTKAWSTVICDESQKIKNRTAQQSKIACRLGRQADRRYILTGTIIFNNPLDAFGQFLFVNPEILGHNYFGFQNQYAVMITHGRARFPVRFINLDRLAEKISPWSYRVTRKECFDMPSKIYETRYVSLNERAATIYKQLGRELMAELGRGLIVSAPIMLTKLLRFSQITAGFVTSETGQIEEVGGEKLGVLREIIDECEGKIVVWVKFKHELEMVRRLLEDIKMPYVALSGDTPQAERKENLSRFNDDVSVRVFLSQIEAGGVGLNLSAASTCVYLSNVYSIGMRQQSEDRIQHPLKKDHDLYIDVVAAGTVDEKIIEALRNKKSVGDLINGDVPISGVIGTILTGLDK